jgi:transcriptional regulator with XRE-family HTH domain
MATIRQVDRHPGGRPRTREPSRLFVRLEAMARRRGLRLDQLAAKAGVSVATLYNIGDPKLSTAKALADALGVTVDRLAFPRSRSAPQSTA